MSSSPAPAADTQRATTIGTAAGLGNHVVSRPRTDKHT